MARATVAILRCPDYDTERVRTAVREALSLIPGATTRVSSGQTVLLKPNLLSANDPPERAVNTHPEFVRAAAEFFIERGCKVIIGDSCGSLAPGSTDKAMELTGLDAVAADTGAELINFDKAPTVEVDVPGHAVLERVRIPRLVREVDLFVTLPKFKTHGLTLLTGAVKNQMGLILGRGKKDIHLAAPRPAALAAAMVDIYAVARPHLALMDGILAMEGNGPAAGDPRPMGLILGSDDCVALDTVMAAIMGCGEDSVDTTRLARERGLGAGSLADISLQGASIEDVRPPDFKMPPQAVNWVLFGLLPAAVLRWLLDQVGSCYATVMDDRCVVCGECLANCPAGALHEDDGKMRVDARRCISCYCCAEVCKERAIRMQRPLLGRIIQKLARR